MLINVKMPSQIIIRHLVMKDNNTPRESNDSTADAIAAVAILLILVAAVVYWLSGF